MPHRHPDRRTAASGAHTLDGKLAGRRTMMSRAGRVQSREQLLEDVWDMSAQVETRAVDTHVKRLEKPEARPRTRAAGVRGVGHRLVDPDAR